MSLSSLSSAAYGTSSLLFAGLGVLLLVSWRGRVQGGLLLAAVLTTLAWCLALVGLGLAGTPNISVVLMLEALRNGAWLLFLLRLFLSAVDPGGGRRICAVFALVSTTLVVAQLAIPVAELIGRSLPGGGRAMVLIGLLTSVTGLALVEQLMRNLDTEGRWAMKFLCLGVGGLFAFDLYLYSDSLLFTRIDTTLIAARGIIQGMVVPLLAVAAVRNPQWSVPVFVSRQVVFHSATLLGAGLYLVVMSGVGFWIKAYGGTWGGFAQVIFLFGAVVLLVVLMLSGQLRARARVFLAKHFYRNRYDYRQEWLRFSAGVSVAGTSVPVPEALVRAVGAIVESPGGALWTRQRGAGDPGLELAGTWNYVVGGGAQRLPAEVDAFLRDKGWVIYIDEWRTERERSDPAAESTKRVLGALPLDELVDAMVDPWVLVPVAQGDDLLGVIGLARSSTRPDLNWEDADLLKTVGRQAASQLALWATSEDLAEARQFEAFNRLSAFVVHDLKNLSAQLALIESNAQRFKHQPEFIDDAFATVANANAKMRRMLSQLRGAQPEVSVATADRARVPLAPLLGRVVGACAGAEPAPSVAHCPAELAVRCDREPLESVLQHLLQNAQEATPSDGTVELSARAEAGNVVICVRDTGCGMDPAFVRERLFRPFDTTKGNAGMGVGVYQSRDFAERNGGALEVDSAVGAGSEFRLRLPLAVPDAVADDVCQAHGKSPSDELAPMPPSPAMRVDRVDPNTQYGSQI